MNIPRKFFLLLAPACMALALAACERGPVEKAGKAVDDAGEKAGEKIKDVTK